MLTDPPSTLVWPASETIHNACGRAGASPLTTCSKAWASARTIWSARSPCSRSCCWCGARSISRCLRAVGWVVSVVGLTTLAALAVPNWTPGPVVGAGGYIGAMGRSLLETHFAQAGAYIFALSVLLAGHAALDGLFHVPRGGRHDQRHRPHADASRPPGPRRREEATIRVKSDLEEEEFERRRVTKRKRNTRKSTTTRTRTRKSTKTRKRTTTRTKQREIKVRTPVGESVEEACRVGGSEPAAEAGLARLSIWPTA